MTAKHINYRSQAPASKLRFIAQIKLHCWVLTEVNSISKAPFLGTLELLVREDRVVS